LEGSRASGAWRGLTFFVTLKGKRCVFTWSNFHLEVPIPPYGIKKDNGASSRHKGAEEERDKIEGGDEVEEEEASLESSG
jgi:hypothetical protein